MPSKLPTAVKKSRGTDRPDRRNRDEPVIDVGAPEMPADLTEPEQQLWRRYVAELRLMGVLTPADRVSLKQLVRTELQVDRLWSMVVGQETVSITSTQKQAVDRVNVLYDKLLAERSLLERLWKSFGLDPVARTAVHTVAIAPKAKAASAETPHGNEGTAAAAGPARFFSH